MLLLVLGGCPQKIPVHLELDPSDVAKPTIEVRDLETAVAATIGRDPLARSPALVPVQTLATIPGAEPIAAFTAVVRDLQRGMGDAAGPLQQLEDSWRGTAAVALARGYRLGAAQGHLAAAPDAADEAPQVAVLALLTPLRPAPGEALLPSAPLAWLGAEPRAAALAYGDRYVLEAWLDGPAIPLAPVATQLRADPYDSLRTSPLGALVIARAAHAAGPIDEGMADLRHATRLALIRAAADRDSEQKAWKELRTQTLGELGTNPEEPTADPVAILLDRATASLTAAAGDDRAAGGALLAIAANRWAGRCAAEPCVGLDRVDTMAAAGRFSPESAELARVWQVVALEEAVDAMDVGHETLRFPRALVDLTDALYGTHVGPFDAGIVRRRHPDTAVWLALGRALGTDGALDWPSVRAEVGAHLAAQARAAADASADPELDAVLDRVAKKAR